MKAAGYEVPHQAIALSISDMTCASCVARVERALKAVPGVVDAQVNLATEQAEVTVLRVPWMPMRWPRGSRAAPAMAPCRWAAGCPRARRAEGFWSGPWPVAISAALSLPLVAPMVAQWFGVHWMLPAWVQWLLATPVRFVFGCAVLQGGLEGGARGRRQYGPAGRARHFGGLLFVPVADVARRRRHASPLLRERGGGHHAGAAGRSGWRARAKRQTAARHPRAGRAAPR
ncbi:cation transporter [Cupriavidus basilensis]